VYPAGSPQPTVSKMKRPEYPRGAVYFDASGVIIIRVRFDESGMLFDPQVVKPLPATMTFVSLDALKDWRLDPPVVNGTPQAGTFCITMNYKLVR
jgi:hypothetical protein